MSPEDLHYAETHEWVHVAPDDSGAKIATVGITAFAVEALSDPTNVVLPEVGAKLAAGEPFGEIESVKAVSDLYSPVDGEVVAVNDALIDELERISEDPYGAGWMVRIRISDEAGLGQLMDHAAYQKQCAEEAD